MSSSEKQSRPLRWWLGGALLAAAVLGCGILIGHYAIESESSGCIDPVAPHSSIAPSPDTALSESQVRRLFFNEVQPNRIREFLRMLTIVAHPAGSAANNAIGQYIKEVFQTALGHDNVGEATYDALLSRPNSSNPNTVYVFNADGSLFLRLENKEYPGDFDGAYFAYAPAGTITSGIVIYANEASDADFEYLLGLGMPVNGSIILARFSGFRGNQVKRCAQYGARAALLFLDPSVVAPLGSNESMVYPNGPWMPPVAIQRGSIISVYGEPLSPGFASRIGEKYRIPIQNVSLPLIPALPIGYGDAQRLFGMMDQGAFSTQPPQAWRPSSYLNYKLGGQLTQNRRLTVTVTNSLERSKITNIIGTIPGCEEPDRYVILGNHFDAWTFGAIDPNSGTAAMLELVTAFGVLKNRDGWCPRRTVIIAGWDAEEFNLIGSNEWVEEHLHILQERTVAYLNADSAVRGQGTFYVAAMPLLTEAIEATAKLIPDPKPVPEGTPQPSLFEVWKASSSPNIDRLGASSDYATIINQAGVTAVDIGFGDKDGVVGYPAYHTAYESFDYVEKFVDPNFTYHATITKFWGELARHLADAVLLPFSVPHLAEQLDASWRESQPKLANITAVNLTAEIDFESLSTAIALFRKNAKDFADSLPRFHTEHLGNSLAVREMNDRMMKVERMFLDPAGIPGRPLDRHVLQAPAIVNQYASTSFSGLMDSAVYIVEAGRKNNLQDKQFWLAQIKLHFAKVVQIVDRAARFLVLPSLSLVQTP